MVRRWRVFLVGLFYIMSLMGPVLPAHAATDPKAIHILSRLSLGPRPGDLEHVQSIGVEGYIKEQLSPQTLKQPPPLKQQLQQFETLKLAPMQVIQIYRPQQAKGQSEAERKAAQKRRNQPLSEARQARIVQAIASPSQLEEVMVNFWFNHFNVSWDKGNVRYWIGDYEKSAIRPYALGSFRELLGATAQHPAMLFYLDNWLNTDPNSPGARGQFKGLNENYARELLELHTLGVDGGYTQTDVVAIAEALTGWGIPRPPQAAQYPAGFVFDAKRHDNRPKTVLGSKITGQGQAAGEQVLDLLAQHPATARHISYELAQYFVADQPPQPLVKRLTDRYLKTDGDIRSVLDTLFHSPEFWDTKYVGTKFKPPYEYVLSTLRAQGSDVNIDTNRVLGMLNQLGMPLFNCRTPDGYANTQAEWLNPEAVTRRVSLATTIARGGGRQAVAADPDQLMRAVGPQISPQTQSVIATSPKNLRAALMLGSPDLMYR
ncbi:MAG: DUF1800 domain-containing protein [Thermosynechococcaceae cyanobacterium]